MEEEGHRAFGQVSLRQSQEPGLTRPWWTMKNRRRKTPSEDCNGGSMPGVVRFKLSYVNRPQNAVVRVESVHTVLNYDRAGWVAGPLTTESAGRPATLQVLLCLSGSKIVQALS